MNCFECDETTEIRQFKSYMYEGVGLSNIVLLNAQVEVCAACDTESLLLRNISKVHNAIGIGIVLHNSQLSGAEVRYLRRNAGFSVSDWAQLLKVAEGTYTKWETDYRPITPQADILARINYLNALKQKDPQNVRLAAHLDAVLKMKIEEGQKLLIAIDAQNLEAPAQYLPSEDVLFAKPETSYVEARTIKFEPLTAAVLIVERSEKTLNSQSKIMGEKLDVCYELATSA
ncbi:MAG TPA: hypothetical protein VF644_01305 [Pyrinomonadaceae bacterium]